MQTVFERNIPSTGLVDRSLAATVLQPFWLDDAPGHARYPALSTPFERYDLIVVGGGYTRPVVCLAGKAA